MSSQSLAGVEQLRTFVLLLNIGINLIAINEKYSFKFGFFFYLCYFLIFIRLLTWLLITKANCDILFSRNKRLTDENERYFVECEPLC